MPKPITSAPTTQPQAIDNVRPRDAATLIVLARDGDQHKVLMGRRHDDHKFMPGKYVFPGGRVDFADSRIKPASELAPQVSDKLQKQMRGNPSMARARALALAAVRETFEETGLALGAPLGALKAHSKSPAWQAFFATGVRPQLASLRFICRAITPPRRVRRFDTRFFLTLKEDWEDTIFDVAPSNELTEVRWVSFAKARELDLPRVTRFVLGDLEKRLNRAKTVSFDRKVPFFRYQGKTWIQDHL